MSRGARGRFPSWRSAMTLLAGLLLAVTVAGPALAFNLTVVDENGVPISNGFRWLLEEDTTNLTTPQDPVADSISVDIHNSYAPVADKGHADTNPVSIPVPDETKRYFVSVLPDQDPGDATFYSISGTAVPGVNDYDYPRIGGNVTVTVNSQPIPTAQISILAFVDHNSINNAPDHPEEVGLPNCTVQLFDDGGGPLMLDGLGNPLGTTYDENGDVITLGDGVILTDANGEATVKYLVPGKYGVKLVPPGFDDAGNPVKWVQTATIEGTTTVDAWVGANEPPLFIEGFGAGFYHVFIGFVKTLPQADVTIGGVNIPSLLWETSPPAGFTGQISGVNRFNHFSRPPTNQGFYAGAPVPECWIGLNDPATGQGLYAAPCAMDSSFSIDGVPPGDYELVTWDRPLLALFGFNTVTVPAANSPTGDAVDLGNVLSFRWFGTLEGKIFQDNNANGLQDAGEAGLGSQAVLLRFRDGAVYQATVSEGTGEYSLPGVFPFFKWLVAEVDFARYKAVSMRTVVDYGGPVDPTDPRVIAQGGLNTAGWDPRAVGVLHPQPQDPNDPDDANPADSLSRTELGPVLTQAIHLFLNQTNIIDWGKQNYVGAENGGISGIVFYAASRAENDPRWAAGEGWEPGIPRVQLALYRDTDNDRVIDDLNGDGMVTEADVDNYPFGDFPGPGDVDRNGDGIFNGGDAIQVTTTDSWDDSKPTGCVEDDRVIHGQVIDKCSDSYGTWNQVRPGVFDGGYAFDSYVPGGVDTGNPEVAGLNPGSYIVQAFAPPGYELQKEEDKNVDFGDSFEPSTLLTPPFCVGEPHLVPAELSLFPGVPSLFAGQTRPLCDRKRVVLTGQANAAAEFHFFTEVPKAARVVGFANNDLAAEFDTTSPVFGEKSAPSWLPVAIKDWAGNELHRVYMDEFGSYNALLPSTYTQNVPSPSGMSPSMLTVVLNDPFFPDGTPDPNYDPDYSVTSWTFNYMAGRTTYLDTPLVPLAAFAGFPKGGFDGNPANGVPVIAAVAGDQGGPLVCSDLGGTTVTLTSLGQTEVTNPDYDFTPATDPTIIRDYGFGGIEGQVLLDGSPLPVASWNDGTITLNLAPGALATGQLTVVRGDNENVSPTGVTLAVVDCTATTVRDVPGSYPTIQAAVDDAAAGDLVLVAPGEYHENVILWKPVRLQGAGAGSTTINGNPHSPASRLADWHAKNAELQIGPFLANEAPGILVAGNATDPGSGLPATPFDLANQSLIDGFKIIGSLAGGGIDVTSDVGYLTISNNTITNNQGSFGAGIVLGTPDTGTPANNTNITIRHNRIVKNGGIQGPGGIAIYYGADNYVIENNYIAGNFSRANGGGIGHEGLSDNGLIRNNQIVYNEIFFGLLQAGTGDGAGIALASDPATNLGTGSVVIDGNLIQGNLAGSGRGGGIRVANASVPGDLTSQIGIYNNMIVNNVSGNAGAGISLQDAVDVEIVNNTIANNDSAATAALTFQPGAQQSTPQPAGVVSHVHGAGLLALGTVGTFSDPLLVNNFIAGNRSFYFDGTLNNNQGGLLPHPTMPAWDLGIVGTAGALSPQTSVLSALTYADGSDYTGAGNLAMAGTPFVRAFNNELATASVIDEGGNAISLKFTNLDQTAGDYHLRSGAVGSDLGADVTATVALQQDFDGDPRAAAADIGADEAAAGNIVATRIGTYDAGTWYLDVNGDGAWNGIAGGDRMFVFGTADMLPVVGDWNRDGSTEVAAFDPAPGTWYFDLNGNGAWDGEPVDRTITGFGGPGSIPVAGDWDGDGTTEIGVFTAGAWQLDANGNGVWDDVAGGDFAATFGTGSMTPVVGDWDNDGVDQIAAYEMGTWYLDMDASGDWNGGDQMLSFGDGNMQPVVGDWNADLVGELGTFQSGMWFLDADGSGDWNGGSDLNPTFGDSGHLPVTGKW